MPFRIFAGLSIVVLILSACTLFESPATRAMRNTPDYRAGYSDGCATAEMAGRGARIRDEESYRTIRAYSLGWNTGNQVCRTGSPAQPASGPFPEPTP